MEQSRRAPPEARAALAAALIARGAECLPRSQYVQLAGALGCDPAVLRDEAALILQGLLRSLEQPHASSEPVTGIGTGEVVASARQLPSREQEFMAGLQAFQRVLTASVDHTLVPPQRRPHAATAEQDPVACGAATPAGCPPASALLRAEAPSPRTDTGGAAPAKRRLETARGDGGDIKEIATLSAEAKKHVYKMSKAVADVVALYAEWYTGREEEVPPELGGPALVAKPPVKTMYDNPKDYPTFTAWRRSDVGRQWICHRKPVIAAVDALLEKHAGGDLTAEQAAQRVEALRGKRGMKAFKLAIAHKEVDIESA